MNYEELLTLIQIVCAIICFFSVAALSRIEKPKQENEQDSVPLDFHEIVSQTIKKHAPQLKENVEKNNALLNRLYAKREQELLADTAHWTHVKIFAENKYETEYEYFVRASPLDTKDFLKEHKFINDNQRVNVCYNTLPELINELQIEGFISRYFTKPHVLVVKDINNYELYIGHDDDEDEQ